MRRIAAAVADDARRFNLREGLTPSDDRLPARFAAEPLPETGKSISAAQMDRMLSDYYRRVEDRRGGSLQDYIE